MWVHFDNEKKITLLKFFSTFKNSPSNFTLLHQKNAISSYATALLWFDVALSPHGERPPDAADHTCIILETQQLPLQRQIFPHRSFRMMNMLGGNTDNNKYQRVNEVHIHHKLVSLCERRTWKAAAALLLFPEVLSSSLEQDRVWVYVWVCACVCACVFPLLAQPLSLRGLLYNRQLTRAETSNRTRWTHPRRRYSDSLK